MDDYKEEFRLNSNTEYVDGEDKYYLNYAKVLETIIKEATR
jgi:hypothetical protein